MPVDAKIQFQRRLDRVLKWRFEKFEFQVGVLNDRDHKRPISGSKKSYAGGPARRIGRTSSGKTIAEVSHDVRKTTGINIFTRPFKSKKNADIVKFMKAYMPFALGRGQEKRVLNGLQAVVRNPILRGDYGRNTAITRKIKGFNRLLIDTAQLFKAITAKVVRKGGKRV